MKKIFTLLLIALICLSCGKKESDVIKIGAILPLTGETSTYGVSLKKGIDLAVYTINKNGGLDGKSLQVIYEDDKGDPITGVNSFRKLIDFDNVNVVIGGMFSNVALAISPVAERSKKVFISPTASAITLTNAGDFIFRIYPSDDYDGMYLANFSINTLRAKSVAILSEQIASVQQIKEKFSSEFKKLGGKIIYDQSFNQNIKNFRSNISLILNSKPDLVFIPSNLNEFALFIQQAKQLGLSKQILTISTIYDPKIFQLATNSAEGVIFSAPMFDLTSKSENMVSFKESYKTKYGLDPDILGGYGYDVLNIDFEAIKKGGNNAEGIKKALYNIQSYPGVTGKTSFDKNGDVNKELSIMQIRNNNFVPFAN